MKNKKCRLFLWISLTVFALSVMAIISSMIISYYKVKTDFPNDHTRASLELVSMVFVSMGVYIPCLGSHLSFTRSVYKVLRYKPRGLVKICYIISASLAFLAFAFQWLTFSGLINLENIGSGDNFTVTLHLCIQWPAFIISLILGSKPIQQND